ncbi:hypothetical protein DICVIV_12614 [Dictyocaulus viviparus]|uniref:Uncharacterized protein n=1 Tax=Dictyocaulus viviparus TaxID=29172 RepID=A0A0D8XA15_DICVI|nr:hypothetical protein DICVIV_12614 [Dictyocaulus viviparus]
MARFMFSGRTDNKFRAVLECIVDALSGLVGLQLHNIEVISFQGSSYYVDLPHVTSCWAKRYLINVFRPVLSMWPS